MITERPSVTVTFANSHPSGTDERRQGTSEADGTDWATSHNGSRSVHARVPKP